LTKKIAIFIDNDFYFTVIFLKKFFKKYDNLNFVVFLSKDFLNIKRIFLMLILLPPSKFFRIFLKVLKNNISNKTEEFLKSNKINYYKLKNINSIEVQEFLKKNNVDKILSVINSKIFKKKFFHSYEIYNLHLGKIPEYKGIVPVINAYIDNRKLFHSSVFRVNFLGIDTGDLIGEKSITREIKDDAFSLYEKLYDVGFEMLIDLTQNLLKSQKIDVIKKINSKDGIYHKYPSLKKVFKFKFLEKNTKG
tara:strand:- start:665 stop:1411 length:747 start_codon:yes stop_codon:yes gene_type:complete